MKRYSLVAVILWLLLVGAACSDEQPSPTPTVAPKETAVAPVNSTPPPLSPTMGIFTEVPSTVWLVDARRGALTTLRQENRLITGAEFDEEAGAVIVLHYGHEEVRLSFVGAELGRQAPTGSYPCRDVPGGVEVGGRVYMDVTCGPVAPGERWMVYAVVTGQVDAGSGFRVNVWDQWAIDLHTDERFVLQRGLRDCGGCDGRFGPGWSVSGRFVYFAETGGQSRVWLSDLERRTTREIASGPGANEVGMQPQWSPVADVLLRPSTGGATIVEELETARSFEIAGLPVPARFDATGRYTYAPGWARGPFAGPGEPSSPQETVVVDTGTWTVLGRLSGAPPTDRKFVDLPAPLVATGDGFVAALEYASGCEGTALYRNVTLAACIIGGVGSVLSPAGRWVALSRKTGETGPARAPGVQANSFNRYDILLVGTATGAEQVVAREALSTNPPVLRWNRASTHLLVRWPFSGYGP
jgi:hypothetical protein